MTRQFMKKLFDLRLYVLRSGFRHEPKLFFRDLSIINIQIFSKQCVH